MRANKPIFNICLRVFLPVLAVLTALLMFLTYRMVWESCNDVSEEDKALCESGVLMGAMVLRAENGAYYEVYEIDDGSGDIAFCVSQEQLGEIPYMEPSYYPQAYWDGPYQMKDLSRGYEIVADGYYLDGAARLAELTQVKVYDFSAYKGHTQPMGRGPGIALMFLWMAEGVVGGFLMLLNLVIGLVIFGINCGRKRGSQFSPNNL